MENEKGPVVANDGEAPVAGKRILSEKAIHNLHDGAPAEILDGHLLELEVDLARVIVEDDVEGDWDADTSPFPAVRAVVPESDDTEMPVNTFRAWFLGIVGGVLCFDAIIVSRPGMISCLPAHRSSSFWALVSTSSSRFVILEFTSSPWSLSSWPFRWECSSQSCCPSAASTLTGISTSRSTLSSLS